MFFLRIIMVLALVVVLPTLSVHAFKCNVAISGFDFGNYDTFLTVPLDSAANLSVTCNNPTKGPKAQPLAVMVTLSPGNSGSYSDRYMLPITGGADRLYYSLSSSPSQNPVWGDGTGGSSVVTSLVTKDTPLNATIYGRIPLKQNVAPGTYNDLITITVSW